MYDKNYMSKSKNRNITVGKAFKCYKTTDYFLEVTFKYPRSVTFEGCIPLKEHYQNVEFPDDVDTIGEYIDECYDLLKPGSEAMREWDEKQQAFWSERRADKTKDVFDALNKDRSPSSKVTFWMKRDDLPAFSGNRQPPARIRDLKKFGFTIATRQNGSDDEIILVRLPRVEHIKVGKRYGISSKLEKRIKTVLDSEDALTGRAHPARELVVDHKFPSARWLGAETRNFDGMTDAEIKEKFQLLTEQGNLLKSRACEHCVQQNKRGEFFGMSWYYEGNETWNASNPTDEAGCVGCPFYDCKRWKNEALKKLRS